MRRLKIFVSSPGDVAEERVLAETVFSRLTREFRGTLTLSTVMWEHEPLLANDDFQSQIESAKESDLFVTIVWSRLGTPLAARPDDDPGVPRPTGTELEIIQALDASTKSGRPALLCYRKTATPKASLASVDTRERLRQYELLDEFWKRTFLNSQNSLTRAFHTFGESYEFERKLYEHARKWLEREAGSAGPIVPRWSEGCPFRGLRVFEAAHRDVYFGRSRAMADVIRLIRETEQSGPPTPDRPRLLLIDGMSGAGKSSLVRAGLIPMLELRAIEGVARSLIVTIKPSERAPGEEDTGVFGVLGAHLVQKLPALETTAKIASRLAAAPERAAALLEGYVAAYAQSEKIDVARVRIVVFVDQLEELFTGATSPEQTERVMSALAEMAQHPNFWIVATIRSDMAHKLQGVSSLAPLLRSMARYTLAPPRPDELSQMIREPAEAAGLVWDVRDNIRLDEELVREAEASPEGLPLLEFALESLYERRDDRRLSFKAYDEMRGLKGALVTAADAVIGGSSAEESATFSYVMRCLVTVDDHGTATRRYAPREEFSGNPAAERMIAKLLEQRLCASDARGGVPVVLLAHEALISSWPRAQIWLKAEIGLVQSRDRMLRDAQLWLDRKKRRGFLATAPEKIAEIRQLRAAGLPLLGNAGDFATASIRERGRLRLLRLASIATVCVLAVAALVAAVVGVTQRERAELALFRQLEDRGWQAMQRDEPRLAIRYALAGKIAAGEFSSNIDDTMSPRWRLLLAAAANRFQQPAALEQPSGVLGREHRLRPVVADGARYQAHVDFLAFWSATLAGGRPPHQVPEILADQTADGSKVLTVSTIYTVGGRRYQSLPEDTASYRVSDMEVTIRIYDTATRAEVATLVEHGVVSASFAYDGSEAMVLSRKIKSTEGSEYYSEEQGPSRLTILSASNGVARSHGVTLSGEESIVRLAADNSRILTCCREGAPALITDVETGQSIPVGTPGATIYNVEFSPDGNRVAVAESGGVVTVWDSILGRRELQIAAHASMVADVDFSPNGRFLMSRGGEPFAREKNDGIRLWNAATGREVATLLPPLSHDIDAAAFSDDGSRIFGRDTEEVEFAWSVSRIAEVESSRELCANDSRAIPSDDGSMLLLWGSSSIAHLCALDGSAEGTVLEGEHKGVINAAAFSVDRRRALTASADRFAVIWDLESRKGLVRLRHATPVRAAAFSPDGHRVVTGAEDGTVILWGANTGEPLKRISAHAQAVLDVRYSPDGSRILTTSADETFGLWDAESGERVVRTKTPGGGAVRTSAFAVGSDLFATAGDDAAVHLWDAKTGEPKLNLQGHRGSVTAISFTSDGALLASASQDGTVRVWETAAGVELESLAVENVDGAAFLSDRKRMVTISRDHRVRIWQLGTLAGDFDELSRFACERILDGNRSVFSTAELLADRAITETFLRSQKSTRSVCEGASAPAADLDERSEET